MLCWCLMLTATTTRRYAGTSAVAPPFKPRPASVRDADTLNLERHTAARRHGLGHNTCEVGEHKAGEHLDGEAAY
jgi:hypothetical protein